MTTHAKKFSVGSNVDAKLVTPTFKTSLLAAPLLLEPQPAMKEPIITMLRPAKRAFFQDFFM